MDVDGMVIFHGGENRPSLSRQSRPLGSARALPGTRCDRDPVACAVWVPGVGAWVRGPHHAHCACLAVRATRYVIAGTVNGEWLDASPRC
jgi:hypothetical protein